MDTATREQIFRLEEEVSTEEEAVAGSCGVRAFFGGVKDRFVVCGYCGLLYIFRCSDGARLCCLRTDSPFINDVGWHPRHVSVVAVAGSDGAVRIFDN